MSTKNRMLTAVITVLGLLPLSATAVNLKDVMDSKIDFSIGGYVKLSTMWTDYSEGDSSGNSLLDTFYFPGAIPTAASGVSGASGENSSDLDFTARETRLNFKISQKIGGHSVMGYLETDFMPNGDAGGNEVLTNSYSPRLRHAFLKFDNWTFGQTWTTYMDVGALPESVDFLAVSESTVFVRQPQIRYTHGPFQVALENPESFNESGDRDDSDMPDLIANYTMKGDWGHVRLNGLVREIVTVNNPAAGDEDSATGWGLGFTGKLLVGKDDLKFSFNHGEGLGRYIGLALPRDATVDAAGDIDLSETTAFFVAYRHWWSPKLRSSVMYSDIDIDYSGPDNAFTSSADSVTLNLMYSPVKTVTLGMMYLHANRELDNGDDGGMDRVQFSAKYAF